MPIARGGTGSCGNRDPGGDGLSRFASERQRFTPAEALGLSQVFGAGHDEHLPGMGEPSSVRGHRAWIPIPWIPIQRRIRRLGCVDADFHPAFDVFRPQRIDPCDCGGHAIVRYLTKSHVTKRLTHKLHTSSSNAQHECYDRGWIVMLTQLADRTLLRRQIALLAGAISLAIVGATTIGSALLARGQATDMAQGNLLQVARSVADRLDQDMAERLREIRNVAALEPLQPHWMESTGSLRKVLDRMQETLPDYAWIGFADREGRVRAATGGVLEGANVGQRPWFKNGIRQAAVEDVHFASLLQTLLTPNADGTPFRFVDLAVPIGDASGQVVGVLGVHLSWRWADVVRREVLASRRPDLKEDIVVLDRAGRVLLGPDLGTAPYTAAQLAAGHFIDERADGTRLATATATRGRGDYPGLGWIVVALQPIDTALTGATQLTGLIILLGLGAALIGMVGIRLVAARLSRPLTQLTEAVDRIGRDPNARMTDRVHGSPEVLRLSTSVRSLLRRIGTAEADARHIEAVASSAAHAAEDRVRRLGADLHAMQVLADTDALTGLLNRRAFLPLANDAMSYFKRYRRAICVLMVDIDHFKRVNDLYGHAAGDEVIRQVGRIIGDAIRTTDKVARFGGEEFVVLLRETDLRGATILADRIRQTVADTVFEPEGQCLRATISIGMAEAEQTDEDIDRTIERADRALYEAKSSGRNCVRSFEAATFPSLRAAA
ncbi:sensor domain-containing diguanylate cyclase [Methylobacterium sp. Leaf399]|uniref:sensor domain-containing diguanylate cyclase n=1 Tax=Methylobacterium sp. Leaf399 TaxID=1736364 RepID=UPI001FCCDF92|nr:sensor domain-containing diguanylate cyclase [Methylobacterium sp. Leaf399]